MMFARTVWIGTVLAAVMLGQAACESSPGVRTVSPAVQPAELGETENVHICQDVLFSAQPDQASFATLGEQNYRSVLNLRSDREMAELDFDEAALVTEQGITYYHVGVAGADGLTDDVLDRVRRILRDPGNRPILVHCATANRVGAVWYAHRVLDAGLDDSEALAEARKIGLRSADLEQRARDYIARERERRQHRTRVN